MLYVLEDILLIVLIRLFPGLVDLELVSLAQHAHDGFLVGVLVASLLSHVELSEHLSLILQCIEEEVKEVFLGLEHVVLEVEVLALEELLEHLSQQVLPLLQQAQEL